jgi:hypothetical protein
MDEQHCHQGATRMTAAERQFERFVSAVRQFECDDGAGRFEQALASLVVARRSRRDGMTSSPTTGLDALHRGELATRGAAPICSGGPIDVEIGRGT